jgi:hypothetical protein
VWAELEGCVEVGSYSSFTVRGEKDTEREENGSGVIDVEVD